MLAHLRNRTTQALLAANALFAILVVAQLLFPASPSTVVPEEMTAGDATMPVFGSAALNPPALSVLGEMLDRPLFYDDRRLPEPPETEAPPPPKPLMLRLQGVAVAGGSRVAVLRNTSNNLLLQLGEGDTHEGWIVDEITATTARFSRGAEVTELPLDPETNGRRR